MMDFAEFSQQTAEQINQELQRILNEWRREVQKTAPVLLPLVDKFIDSCQGGKGLRGVLVVLGYEIASAKREVQSVKSEDTDIFKVAAAYEIIHTAILAHDDIIDQSPLRRGQPSLYKALGDNHYGVSQAICLGDAGFFLVFQVILKTFFDDRQILTALKWFSKIMLETVLGQMLDIDGRDPIIVAKLKTARYSLTGPLVLGAILAGTGFHPGGVKACLARFAARRAGRRARLRGEISSLEEFGENLGIAFQIKDDILDGEDHRWGGLDAAKKAAEKYKNQALKALPQLTKGKEMSKLLEQMAEYLVQRKK